MVDALRENQGHTSGDTYLLNQMLHGYSEGHRLLQSSISIPDEISRTVLRLSDLSGTNLINGFEEYITGYPLTYLHSYALAKSWYASEMPRPGCVWTHTILIPQKLLAHLRSLNSLLMLFKRPDSGASRNSYSKPLTFDEEERATQSERRLQAETLKRVLYFHYKQNGTPVLLAARSSRDFEDLLFALWSQKWPSLRNNFTFCTGSLSGRTFNKRPLDIQCVPSSKVREVLLELSNSGARNPVVANSDSSESPFEIPSWAILATKDALAADSGKLRTFLWAVADDSRDPSEFTKYTLIFEALHNSITPNDLISLVAKCFPEPDAGRQLKRILFTEPVALVWPPIVDAYELLLAMATTTHYQAFDCNDLALIEKGQQLSLHDSERSSTLIGQLFSSSLNPLGEQILAGLVYALEPEAAHRLTSSQLQFLPSLSNNCISSLNFSCASDQLA